MGALIYLLLLNSTFADEPVEPAAGRPWEADCRNVAAVDFPKADRPTEEERTTLLTCDPKKLYYGIGMPEDRVKARKCALTFKRGDDVFTNEVILMLVYANGQGTKRNLPLAMKLACGLEATRPEMLGRIERLKSMKGQSDPEEFDFCEDAIGSLVEGRCAALNEEIVASRREIEWKRVTGAWPVEHRRALEELKKAVEAFAEKRAELEVDLSGEGKAALQVQTESEFLTGFLHALEDFEEGKLPGGTRDELKRARSSMEDQLEKILDDEEFFHGTVDRDDIRTTQKHWAVYREAWIKFAAIRYPKVTQEVWDLWLHRERTRQLQALQNYEF